jgi:hypothetical protein
VIGNGRQKLTGALCAAILSLSLAATAEGAIDPVSVYSPPATVPPGLGFDGPCGLAVDVVGNFYVSDHYHHTVDVFGSTPTYKTQAKEVDPLGGPCGLAVNSTGKLYVNSYHRNVVRYTPSTFPSLTTNTTYGSLLTIDSDHPTGVSVGADDTVYVNNRTHITAYDPSGVKLSEVGAGNLMDGYGIAVSQFASTFDRVYVADAATNTIKAYEPPITTPVATVAGPPGGFGSLADSAIAVDRVNGDIYVADRRSSSFTERPESTIQIFDSGGNYEGHLKYNVIDAAPVGLAVDNSSGVNQGRVYVTSGNTSGAVVYIYTSGAATAAAPLPPATSSFGSGEASTNAGAAVTRGAIPAVENAVPAVATASPAGDAGRTARRKHRAKRKRHNFHHHAKRRGR